MRTTSIGPLAFALALAGCGGDTNTTTATDATTETSESESTETEATTEAPATVDDACLAKCEALVTCGIETSTDACVMACLDEVAGQGQTCLDAQIALQECLSQSTCEELETGLTPPGCATQQADFDAQCGADCDEELSDNGGSCTYAINCTDVDFDYHVTCTGGLCECFDGATNIGSCSIGEACTDPKPFGDVFFTCCGVEPP